MDPTSAAHRVIKTSWRKGLGISTATTWSSRRQHFPPGAPQSKIPPFLLPSPRNPTEVGETAERLAKVLKLRAAASASTSAAGRGEFESDGTCADP